MPQDTWQYGFYGLRNDTTIWSTDRGQVTLPAPSLNISAFYLDNIHTHPTVATSWTGWGYGNEWVDPRTGHQPFSYKERVAWTVANQTFDVDQIVANASCQPVQNVSTQRPLLIIQHQPDQCLASLFRMLTSCVRL